MGIRKGAQAIQDRNKEIAKRNASGRIPELILFDDGDIAIFRILTDDPIDVDFHEVRDKAISKRPLYYYCTQDDDGSCEHCEAEIPLVRMFMFWTYVHKILHMSQNDDKENQWDDVKVGTRTMYVEPVEAPSLIRRKYGRGSAFWQQFEDIFDNFGTWKDRDLQLKRKGARGDMDTIYTLTHLDKSAVPEHVMEVASNLPPLESVAKGIVTKLDFGVEDEEAAEEKEGKAEKKKEEKPRQTKSKEDKAAAEVDLPDVDGESLFGEDE